MARKFDNRRRIKKLEERVDRLETFSGGIYCGLLLLVAALIALSFI